MHSLHAAVLARPVPSRLPRAQYYYDLQRLQSIMTVHVNTIMQAAPSQRRIISISEASNQLLCFNPRTFSLSESDGGLTFFLKSCSRSKKLQPGGKPNSFAFRNPGRPRRSITCSRDGSRTASRFAIQVNRDRLRTSRAGAEETAGEAAARREEDQHQTAAARDGERLDSVDNVGAFTHNCRDIRPHMH